MKVAIQAIPLKGRPYIIRDDAGDGPLLFDAIKDAQDWLTRRNEVLDFLGSGVKGWQFIFEL